MDTKLTKSLEALGYSFMDYSQEKAFCRGCELSDHDKYPHAEKVGGPPSWYVFLNKQMVLCNYDSLNESLLATYAFEAGRQFGRGEGLLGKLPTPKY